MKESLRASTGFIASTAKKGMENSLRATPQDIHAQYEKQIKDLQEAYGEAMLELRARKKFHALMEREDGN